MVLFLTRGIIAPLVVLCIPFFSYAATIAELQAQLQVLMAQLSVLQSQTQITVAPPAGGAASVPCPNLARNLFRGLRGADVTQLQQFLISQNLLASDSATGYFGALTERAVQQWQSKNSIVLHGTAATTDYGAVGPKTRAAIARCTGVSMSTNTTAGANPQTTNIPTSPAAQQGVQTVPQVTTSIPTTTPVPNSSSVAMTTSVMSGSFDPVTWMNSTKGIGNAKLFGELWDENKQTWVKNGGLANPMKMVADYANRHVYFHKDSSWQDFVGQTYNFDANNVWIRTETMGYFNCTDVNPQTGRCDHYTDSTPWDIRNDKFRLFVSTNDAQSASHGYRLAPRPVTHGWQGLIDSFDTYYCNSFSELRTSTCTLYQRGNQILISVYFYKNFDIFNDPSDRAVAMPSGTPEQKLFDVMVVSIEQGLCDGNASASTPRCIAIERNFYGRVGNDYWGLVRFDNGIRKNGRYELTNRAVAYTWDKNYDPKFDDLKIRALEDDNAHFSPPLQTPPSPTGLVAACSADGKNVTLSWNATSGATGYNLAVDDTGNQSSGCSAPTVTGPNGTCVLTTDYGSSESTNTTTLGITPGRNYSWWLQSKNTAGVSPIPAIGASFSCMASPSNIPTNLIATCDASGTQATFSWGPVQGATSYALRVNDTTNEASGCSARSVNGVGGTCVSPTDYVYDLATSPAVLTIPTGKTLEWWIHAIKPDGIGSPAIGTTFACVAS